MSNPYENRCKQFDVKPNTSHAFRTPFGGVLGRVRNSKKIAREEIISKTAEFLASGGKITKVHDTQPLSSDIDPSIEQYSANEVGVGGVYLIQKHNQYNIF